MKNLNRVIIGLLVAVALVGTFIFAFEWGKRRTEARVAELSGQLAESQETVEINKGLYAKQVLVLEDSRAALTDNLNAANSAIHELIQQLDDSKAKVLAAEQLTLKWKKAYEKLLDSTQTDEPGPDGTPRKRVDFQGNLGPIRATGHTLTDPPETFLKLEQVIPLTLTVAVAQNPDGKWVTYVTSSDENLDVKVDLAGVSPHVLSPTWSQRIWADVGIGFLGGRSASLGLSYRGDRFSFGPTCTVWQEGYSCGLGVGVRIWR